VEILLCAVFSCVLSAFREDVLVCFVICAWLSRKWRITTKKKETGIDVLYYCNSPSLMVIVVSKSNDEKHVKGFDCINTHTCVD
jgi:hypothetical protein